MKVYIASKSKHGPRWRALRDAGIPINATWIDESDEGATSDWHSLWERCIHEASTADVVIMYVEHGETHKGSMIEVGTALAAGVPVLWVGPAVGSVTRSWRVFSCDDLGEALSLLNRNPKISEQGRVIFDAPRSKE